MPFGTTVTNFIADLSPADPLAPQVVGDFARTLPPNPIKGELVSNFADSILPPNPIHPADLGSSLSDYLQILLQPDPTVGGDLIL